MMILSSYKSERTRPDMRMSPVPLGSIDDGMLSPQAALSNYDEHNNSKLESFLKYLIENSLVDNEDDQSETIHRFLEIFEQFENDVEAAAPTGSNCNNNEQDKNENNNNSIDEFETRAIFTLADFLKSLGPNEYYDIAQKFFNKWDKWR